MGDLFATHKRIVTTGSICFGGPVERNRLTISRMQSDPKLYAIFIALVLHGLAALVLVSEPHHVPRHMRNVTVALQIMPVAAASPPAPLKAAPPAVTKAAMQPDTPAAASHRAGHSVPVKPPLTTVKPALRHQAVVPRPREAPHPMPRAPHPSAAANRLASAPETQTTPVANPAPAPASSQLPVTVSPSWQSQLGAWLEAHKHYPEEAREYGQEGTATIRFTVARDGHVTNVVLVNGSGVARLDSAAVQMLQGAVVPAFPRAMTQAKMTITISINYALDDDETAD